MGHTKKDRNVIIARINRIQGQLAGAVEALENDHDCGQVLQIIASCRGAIHGLMAEVLEEHVRTHVMTEGKKRLTARDQAALDVVSAIRSYMR